MSFRVDGPFENTVASYKGLNVSLFASNAGNELVNPVV